MNEPSTAPLVPIEQREVALTGGERVSAILIEVDGEERVYVPVRPICDLLGINWPSQTRRISDDPVLSAEAKGVVIMTTPSKTGRGGGPQVMTCLPLEFLHGWLFGLQPNRVKAEYRETLLAYKRECYRLLYEAFYGRALARRVSGTEGRLDTLEQRVDAAAMVVGALRGDVAQIKNLLQTEQPVSEQQAAEIAQAVKALASLLTERASSKNHFQGIWGEINRRFRVATYRNLPARQYREVLSFIAEWHERVSTAERPPQ